MRGIFAASHMRLAKIILALLLAAFAAGGVALFFMKRPADKPGEFSVEMTARDSRFKPAEIRVAVGTRVKIRIRSVDRDHGIAFKLVPEGQPEGSAPGLRFSKLNPDWILKKGSEHEIEFVAERAGSYEFACSVFCGMGHAQMLGRVIVH